jgi:hypothetical protein
MAHYLTIALHLFVVAMMAAFIVGCTTALTGTYVLKSRRSRLIRERARLARKDAAAQQNLTPYKAKKINKRAEIYVVRYAA